MSLVKNITLAFSVIAGRDKAILAGARDDMEFVDGKPTGKRLGSRYDIICHANGFQTVTVKVPDTPLAISQEDLDARNATGNFVFCSFDGFNGKLYQDFRSPGKEIKVSATATSIKILGDNVSK